MNLIITQACTLFDFLYIRKLRNSVRYRLTGSSKKISFFEQIKFYFRKSNNIDLYIVRVNNKRIGYLLIRKSNCVNFITEVIEENFRGQGIGSRLVEFAKEHYEYLEAHIFLDNYASIILHEKNQFKLFQEKNGILIYRFKSD